MSHFEIPKKLISSSFYLLLGLVLPIVAQASIPPLELCREPASINRAVVMISTPSKVFYGQNGKSLSPELIATFNQIKASEKPLDLAQLIPLDMIPSDNSSQVFSQVADRSMTNFLNSPEVRATSFGRTATSVENSMKKEIVLGSAQSVQHKFNFNVQAFQTVAQVQYTGVTNAAVKYKISESKLAVEIFEKIKGGKDIVLSHISSPVDRISQLSLRWNF
jgi:hypothetical protein